MVSSTTLRSGFRLIRAKSYPITLQYLICQYFLHQQQKQPSLHACFNLTTLKFPAGLRVSVVTILLIVLVFIWIDYRKIVCFSRILHQATSSIEGDGS